MIEAAIALGLAGVAALIFAVVALSMSFWRHPTTEAEYVERADLERAGVSHDQMDRAADAPDLDSVHGMALHGYAADAQHEQAVFAHRWRARALLALMLGVLSIGGAVAAFGAWRARAIT